MWLTTHDAKDGITPVSMKMDVRHTRFILARNGTCGAVVHLFRDHKSWQRKMIRGYHLEIEQNKQSTNWELE